MLQEKSKYAPVVVFCYNRSEAVRQCLDALASAALANETDVYVFADAARESKLGDREKVARTRAALRGYERYFHHYEIEERPINYGLNANMLDGIGKIIEPYGRVIVMEDDIVAGYSFLCFMNQALDTYAADENIFSIAGYNPVKTKFAWDGDSFAYGAFRSWGWAIWRDRWQNFDIHEKTLPQINLEEAHREAIMYSTCILPDLVYPEGGRDRYLDYRLGCKELAGRQCTIYPVKSLCGNVGSDGTGMTQGDKKLSNPNFDPSYDKAIFDLSSERLTAASDPYYFFRFRWEEFAMDVYFDANCERNFLYKNCYRALAELYRHGGRLMDGLREKGIQSIAIYGWGEAGKLLYDIAKREKMPVDYVIDRAFHEGPVKFYQTMEQLPKTDLVIVTALRDFFFIDEEFCYRTDLRVTSFDVVAIAGMVRACEKGNDVH